jgi:hypothetical protein
VGIVCGSPFLGAQTMYRKGLSNGREEREKGQEQSPQPGWCYIVVLQLLTHANSGTSRVLADVRGLVRGYFNTPPPLLYCNPQEQAGQAVVCL